VLGSTRGIGPNQTTAAFDLFAEEFLRKHPGTQVWSAEDILTAGKVPDVRGDTVTVAVTENYPLRGRLRNSERFDRCQIIATASEVQKRDGSNGRGGKEWLRYLNPS
jgi:hypothetical protein